MALIFVDDDGMARIECANGFVARVVGSIYDSENFGCHEDARQTAEILNKHFATAAPRQTPVPAHGGGAA